MKPGNLGYRMPAEWEKHEAIWIAWPHHRGDWPDKFDPIPWVYAEIVRVITMGERARILVQNKKAQENVTDILERNGVDLGKVDLHIVPTNRVWTRDSGPTFLLNKKKEPLLLDWKFNAWAKYPNHKLDNRLPEKISAEIGIPTVQPKHKGKQVVLEGGSIDVNGKGILLTTEECLLSKVQERNPGFTREDYEQVFADYLGIDKVVWLGNGIKGDDTHGHVDDISRFVSVDTVVTVIEKDKKSDNYAPLQENLKRIKKAGLNAVELPMPKPVVFEGEVLPASYANFLITNKAVIVPTFNDANDRIALNIIANLFPNRETIGIHAVDLVWGLGTIHCLSQQQPSV